MTPEEAERCRHYLQVALSHVNESIATIENGCGKEMQLSTLNYLKGYIQGGYEYFQYESKKGK